MRSQIDPATRIEPAPDPRSATPVFGAGFRAVALPSPWITSAGWDLVLFVADAKRQSTARLTAVLDQGACLAWFAAAVLLSPTRIPYLLEELYMTGVPGIPLPVLQWLQQAVVASTAAITLAFAVNALAAWKAASRASPSRSRRPLPRRADLRSTRRTS